MSREKVKNWFDRLQDNLAREAELAGVLDHGSMIGTAREFFVRRMLATILPPAVHIGTGQVIGGENAQISKQIDVIIYDSRCPFLESQPGMGLYFVDGVIATIEIKSTLNSANLKIALDNCRSVMQIPLHPATPIDVQSRVTKLQNIGMSELDAIQTVHRESTPRTYIFAFKSNMKAKSLCKTVSKWYDEHEQFDHPQNPFLPSVISVPDSVGLQSDWWLHPDSHRSNYVIAEMQKKHGTNARIVMTFLESKRYFGWLAIHLIQTINFHLGLGSEHGGVRKAIADYLPGNEYFKEAPAQFAQFNAVVWGGESRRPSFLSMPNLPARQTPP